MAVRIVQYLCAQKSCGAIWRVLPSFLARHLWWAWRTVERAVQGEHAASDRSPPPPQTRRRWQTRLASSARVLVALLAARDHDLAAEVGGDATRAAFVRCYADRTRVVDGERLARVAILAHQLERGVRLM